MGRRSPPASSISGAAPSLERRQVATRAERGGAAVLADCAALAAELGGGQLPVGIGLCELVDLAGRPASADTIDWRGLDPAGAIGAPSVVVESDVRAAALAEARFGAGAGVSPFLFAIVGTGASACLVVDGRPYAGGRGEAIVLGAPPVELVASGRALARAAGLERAEDVLADPAQCRWSTPPRPRSAACWPFSRTRSTRRWSSSGAGSAPRRRSRSGSSGRARHCSPTPACLRSGRRLRLGRDGGVIGAALVALAGRVRLPPVLDETGLWRDVMELPSSLATTLEETAAEGTSPRCSEQRAFAASSRAATAPRTTSPSRCGSRHSRAYGAPRWSPCRAVCWRGARSPGGPATSCSRSPPPASSATSSRRSTPARRRRTQP